MTCRACGRSCKDRHAILNSLASRDEVHKSSGDMEDPAISRFREYLRINTTSVANLDHSGQQPDYGMTVY